MERGEEEAPTAAALHLRAAISADMKAVRFRRAAAENFRPEIFEARATLREQRESAVGRRIAKPKRPRLPEDRTARLRHRNPSDPSPSARNRGVSPFTQPCELHVAGTGSRCRPRGRSRGLPG